MEAPLTLLASFMSFFHETMVVSPGRRSTVNICRSPDLTNDDEALDESPPPPPPPPARFSSSIECGRENSRSRNPRVSGGESKIRESRLERHGGKPQRSKP